MVSHNRKKAEFENTAYTKRAHKAECQHFLDSIKNSTKPITDGKEGVNVLKVVTLHKFLN